METPNLQEQINDNLDGVTAGIQNTFDIEARRGAPQESTSPVNLGGITFSIQNFYNSTDRDVQELTEEAMEVAEDYIRRRGGVFA